MTSIATICEVRDLIVGLEGKIAETVVSFGQSPKSHRISDLEEQLFTVLTDPSDLLDALQNSKVGNVPFLWPTSEKIAAEYQLQRHKQVPLTAIGRRCAAQGRHVLLTALAHQLAMYGDADADLIQRFLLVMQTVDCLGPDFEVIVRQIIYLVHKRKPRPTPLDKHVEAIAQFVRYYLPDVPDPDKLVYGALNNSLLYLYELANERYDGRIFLHGDFIYSEVVTECRHLVMLQIQNIFRGLSRIH